jgi:L-malate glycosyltransferase
VRKHSTLPHLRFVGPMIGRNPGQVTTQGEVLADRFTEAGYSVSSVSAHPNRYVRLLDIVKTLLTQGHSTDVMMLQVFGGPSFVVEDLASWIGQRKRQPIVMTLHGGAFPEFQQRYPQWTRRVLRRATRIVAPSAYLARAVEQRGFTAEIIPNLIELVDYPFRQRTNLAPRLFWMRSFHPVWNPQMAVRVLAKLRQRYPEATLVMAGQDKGLQSECERLAEELGVRAALELPGFIDAEQKRQFAAASDVFINTNRIDNMPVAVVEACAFGLPVVSTSVGGIPDLLTDGESGLLVASDDDDAMVAAILQLLNEPNLAANLSSNGRRLAEKSAWEAVRQQWETLFSEL